MLGGNRGGLMAKQKKFKPTPTFPGKVVPKEQCEWSDWRVFENDMRHVIWEYLRINMEVFEPHYGD